MENRAITVAELIQELVNYKPDAVVLIAYGVGRHADGGYGATAIVPASGMQQELSRGGLIIGGAL